MQMRIQIPVTILALALCAGPVYALSENVWVTPTNRDFERVHFEVVTGRSIDDVHRLAIHVTFEKEEDAFLRPEVLSVRYQGKVVVLCRVAPDQRGPRQFTYAFAVAQSHTPGLVFDIGVGDGITWNTIYRFRIDEFLPDAGSTQKDQANQPVQATP